VARTRTSRFPNHAGTFQTEYSRFLSRIAGTFRKGANGLPSYARTFPVVASWLPSGIVADPETVTAPSSLRSQRSELT
jgi:hypothetical protein